MVACVEKKSWVLLREQGEKEGKGEWSGFVVSCIKNRDARSNN